MNIKLNTNIDELKHQIELDKEHSLDIIAANIPQKTAYQYMSDNNLTNRGNIALTFRNRKITYDELEEKISQYAKAFIGIGVQKGDRVALLLPNFPESTFIAYALNKIGAVSDNIDPRVTPTLMKHFLKTENIKMIVSFDASYDFSIKPIEREIKEELGIDKIIVLGIQDTLIFPEKQLFTLKQKLDSNKSMSGIKSDNVLDVIKLGEFLNNSRYVISRTNPFTKNEIATICHSSGTTGMPKVMPATNENMNFLIMEHLLSDADFKNVRTFLHVLPGFAQFGFSDSMHLGHCLGLNMIETPQIDTDSFAQILLDNKPNCVFGIPSWWLSLIEKKRDKKIDLSFLYEAVAGGDSMTPEQMERINNFLATNHAHCKIRTGYGMSEFCGSCSITDPKNIPTGGLGTFLPGASGKIIDFDTYKEVDDGKIGMFCIRKESMPIEEIDGHKVYNSIMIDGKKYLQTGDVATRNAETGEYFLSGRASGMFPRYDGYKVCPCNIEKEVSKCEKVKDCMVTSYYEEKKCGKMPIAHITLQNDLSLDECKKMIEGIIENNILKSNIITSRDIPSKWRIRESLPLTPNSKRDYNKLQAEGLSGEEIDVEIEESNLEITAINVSVPLQKHYTKKK